MRAAITRNGKMTVTIVEKCILRARDVFFVGRMTVELGSGNRHCCGDTELRISWTG
jgi:hypothetical protein